MRGADETQGVPFKLPRYTAVVASVVALVALVARGTPAAAASAPLLPVFVAQPSTYHGDLSRDGMTQSSTITPGNAGTLGLAWKFAAGNVISDEPAVVKGIAYWGDWNGYEHATSSTGVNLWSTFLGTTTNSQCIPSTAGVASSATVAALNGVETVWTGDGDGSVSALNASSGAVLWKTAVAPSSGGFIWSSPALYAGSIFIGVASFGDCPLIPGEVVKLDASTGSVQAVLDTAPAGCIGNGVWSSPAVDTTLGAVYVTTGNANCTTSLQNAILKVNASTLALEDSWQIPPAQWVFDSDWGSSPTFFTASIGGVVHQMVGSAAKNGTFYALDRNNIAAGPLWTLAIADGGDCPQCGNGSISPAAFDGTTLYVAGGSVTINSVACKGTVDAVAPDTGTTLWRDCLQGGPVLAAITMVPGVLFVADGSQLTAIRATDGVLLFTHTESGGGIFYGPATAFASQLWIGNTNGSLLSFVLPYQPSGPTWRVGKFAGGSGGPYVTSLGVLARYRHL